MHSRDLTRQQENHIEIGHRSAFMCHLGNIAWCTESTLHTGPASGHILNNPDLQALWTRNQAASESRQRGGKPVEIAEVIATATKEAARLLDDRNVSPGTGR